VKALLIAALLLPTPAVAFQGDWIDRATEVFHEPRARRSEVRSYRKVVRPAKPKPAPVIRDDNGAHCQAIINVVGSQWVGDSGAQESAKKAFMEEVRWRYGEAYMDITQAQDIAIRCARSSIGEVVSQVLHRCEIKARPCRKGFDR